MENAVEGWYGKGCGGGGQGTSPVQGGRGKKPSPTLPAQQILTLDPGP